MSCENLVCAACGGAVADARCPTCRASRERVHVHPPSGLFGPLAAAVVALALAVAAVGAGR